MGFALYLSKATALVIPVLGAAEIALAWPSFGRLAAVFCGLLLGELPELPLFAQRHVTGWGPIAATAERNVRAFPRAFFDSVLTVADHRIELVAVWALAIGAGTMLLVRAARRHRRGGASEGGRLPRGAAPPVTLAIVVGVSLLHLAALMVMAEGGVDGYTIYGYPTLVVLLAVLVASLCAAAARWGEGYAALVGAAAVAATFVLYRPSAVTWQLGTVAALWHNRAGAACSWHLAEGFLREYDYGLAPPGRTREQHAIERCRSLSERDLVLDCIGGIARERHVRHRGGLQGEPPAGLDATERRAYAYYWGIHRAGDTTPCGEFDDPDLRAECVTGTEMECLQFADINTRFFAGRFLGKPRCAGRGTTDGRILGGAALRPALPAARDRPLPGAHDRRSFGLQTGARCLLLTGAASRARRAVARAGGFRTGIAPAAASDSRRCSHFLRTRPASTQAGAAAPRCPA